MPDARNTPIPPFRGDTPRRPMPARPWFAVALFVALLALAWSEQFRDAKAQCTTDAECWAMFCNPNDDDCEGEIQP